MSLSKPAAPRYLNPATKFVEWKGSRTQGFFQYYDKKEEDVQKRNKIIDFNKGFIVLDGIDEKLFSITGYNESVKASIISNEVRTLQDALVVKQYNNGKAETLLTGSYEELKETIKESRMYDYTQCFYLFFEGELIHLKLKGAGLSQWFTEVQPNMNAASSVICHSATGTGKKGSVEYTFPNWKVLGKIDDETLSAAIECDEKILQPYLSEYFNKSASNHSSANQAPESQQVDTSKWRDAKTDSGIELARMSHRDLLEIQDSLIESGKQTTLLDYVGHAIFDYQKASQQWQNQKSKVDNRELKDFSVDEIQAALSKIPFNHPAKIYLECALAFKIEENQGSNVLAEDFGDDDDIPF